MGPVCKCCCIWLPPLPNADAFLPRPLLWRGTRSPGIHPVCGRAAALSSCWQVVIYTYLISFFISGITILRFHAPDQLSPHLFSFTASGGECCPKQRSPFPEVQSLWEKHFSLGTNLTAEVGDEGAGPGIGLDQCMRSPAGGWIAASQWYLKSPCAI